jgi:hypothetical protein
MMHAGLGIGLDRDRAGPDLLRADAGMVDRGLPEHAGRLRRVGVELVAGDDPHAVMLPARLVIMIMRMVVIVRGSWPDISAPHFFLAGPVASGRSLEPHSAQEPS